MNTDELNPRWDDPFRVLKEYVEWYPENAPAALFSDRGFAVHLLAEVERLKNELANANDLLHDVVLGHNLRTKNRKMWRIELYEDESLPLTRLHEWFLEQQGEEE